MLHENTILISIIADLILFFHFCITIFITFGLFFIPIGYKFNWEWVAKKRIRIIHIGMMMFVTLETVLGITCPLTSIENNLRRIYQSKSFIEFWIKQVIYWDFTSQFFITLYCILLGWTFLMWKLFPPK
jgi:hypothetical protein